MASDIDPLKLGPDRFEEHVRSWFAAAGLPLSEFSAVNRQIVAGTDGDYEIDVVARFEAMGLSYVTLIECKRHRNPIKREMVQALHAKMQSTGAQKGVLVATAEFQRGAVEYARVHGIALIEMMRGRTAVIQKAADQFELPDDIPEVVGWMHTVDDDGAEQMSRVDVECIQSFRDALLARAV